MPANLFPLNLAALGGLARGMVQGQSYQDQHLMDQLRMQAARQEMALQQQRMQWLEQAGNTLGLLGPGGGMGMPQMGGGGLMGPWSGGGMPGMMPGGGGGYGMPTPYAPYAPSQVTRYPLDQPQGPGQFLIPGTDQPLRPRPTQTAGLDVPELGAGARLDPALGPMGLGGDTPSPSGSALAGETPERISLPELAQGVGSAADQTTYPPDRVPYSAGGDPTRGLAWGHRGSGELGYGPISPDPYTIAGGYPNQWYPRHGPAYPGDPGPMFGGMPWLNAQARPMPLGRMPPLGDPSQWYGGYTSPQFTGDPTSFMQPMRGYGGGLGQSPFPEGGRGPSGGLGQITNEIFGLESSWGRNPNVWSGLAKGPMQITPGTFNRYAQPGENIMNPSDNMRVGQRIAADLYQKSGNDPAATLVGYNAGEGAMRKFQESGGDPRSVRLEPAYQRAVAQVQQGQFRTSLNADLTGMMSPQDRAMGGYGVQRTLAGMPNPMAMYGRVDIAGLANLIERANPGISGAAKMGVFSMLYPMLHDQAKEDFQTSWDMYKEQEHEREFGITAAERQQEFGIRMGELEATREERYAPKFGTPENFTVTTADGKTQPVTGMAITSGRGAGQIMTPDPQSGQMRPITTVFPGATIKRDPLGYGGFGQTFQTPDGRIFRAKPDGTMEELPLPPGAARTGTAGAGRAAKPMRIVDQSGQPVGEPFMARETPQGYVDAETGEKIPVEEGQRVMPFKQDAARVQQVQARVIGAANTASFYLHNLSRLPMTASRGAFMGVETRTPEALTEALKRTFARGFTDLETKEMQQTAAGLGRVFGMLEGQGGLQGMQTYGTMIESAMTPQAGDPPILTMRRMADMRGIIERATETGEAQSTDPKIKELLRKVRAEAEASVPYTMDEVNNLEESIRARGGDPSDLTSTVAGESIRDFAGKVFQGFKGGGGGSAVPKIDEEGNEVQR